MSNEDRIMYDIKGGTGIPAELFLATLGGMLSDDNLSLVSVMKILDKIPLDISDSTRTHIVMAKTIIAQQAILGGLVAILDAHGIISAEDILSAMNSRAKEKGMSVSEGQKKRLYNLVDFGHMSAKLVRPAKQTEDARL